MNIAMHILGMVNNDNNSPWKHCCYPDSSAPIFVRKQHHIIFSKQATTTTSQMFPAWKAKIHHERPALCVGAVGVKASQSLLYLIFQPFPHNSSVPLVLVVIRHSSQTKSPLHKRKGRLFFEPQRCCCSFKHRGYLIARFSKQKKVRKIQLHK